MVHTFTCAGQRLALDVGSGALHHLDDLAYRVVSLYETHSLEQMVQALAEYPAQEVEECYQEVEALKEKGELFTPLDDNEQTIDDNGIVKALCLHVAHDCNLRCGYCFASTGGFDGTRCLMPYEVGKKALDFLVAHSGKRVNLEVDFFGGEPMMNFDVVKRIVAYGRELEKTHNKKFRFTITTNGLLLNDDMIDFINKEMYNVVCSTDGRKEVNDRVRARVDGSGCYDAIIPHFQELVRKRENSEYPENWQYYVRGTFTKYNKDFGEDVLHMNSLGFDQISIEPVVADPKQPYALTYEDLPEVFEEYDRLSKIMIEKQKSGKGFNFYHFMIDLDQGPCAIKRLRGCGCGNEYVAITPDGDVYPCHQFVGHEEWKMGNVFDLSINKEMKDNFARATVYHKPKCQDCWAKFYCSGGCNANNWQYMGNVLDSFDLACEMEKKRLECAIMIQAALAE